MFRVLIPAAAALSLAAFAVQSRPSAPVDDHPPMQWLLSHDGEAAKLAYGVANSDILAVMITCAAGDRTAAVYGDVKPAGARMIPARHSPSPLDPMTGDLMEDVRIPVAHPGLRSLAEHGVMTVEGEAGAFVLKADRQERAAARRFIAYCESARV